MIFLSGAVALPIPGNRFKVAIVDETARISVYHLENFHYLAESLP
jgi:hypothetical protein